MAYITLRNTKQNRSNLTTMDCSPHLVEKMVVRFKDTVRLPAGPPGEMDSKHWRADRIYTVTGIFFGPGATEQEGIEGIPEGCAKIYYRIAEFRNGVYDSGVRKWENYTTIRIDSIKEFEVWFSNAYRCEKRIRELEARIVELETTKEIKTEGDLLEKLIRAIETQPYVDRDRVVATLDTIRNAYAGGDVATEFKDIIDALYSRRK